MAKILKAENIQTDLLGSNGNNAFSLQRNSSSLVTLNTSDNVGIGTTAPTSKLEIRGSSNPKIAITSDDTAIDNGAEFIVNLKNASNQLFQAATIRVKHALSSQTAGAENSYISFLNRNAGSLIERIRITAAGGISFGATGTNYGTTAHVLKSAGDSAPVWGFITDANVSTTANIDYSKLFLGNGIVNADVNTNAGIAYSKLALNNTIVNANISTTAAIVDTKLATISTAGKVSNSATTATNANTVSAIVARDASGNFNAGTITASLNGNSTTATTASACSGNSATATTASACSGNSATATTATTATTVSDLSITFGKLSTSAAEATNVAKRTAKAWVNFNGSTVTNPASTTGIRSSFNVSSILDNGTGRYTINFTVAMSNANYVTQYTGGIATAYDFRAFNNIDDETLPTTSKVTVYTMDPAANFRDNSLANVVVFG